MYKNAIQKFLKLKLVSLIRDDDSVDQVHHRLTPIMLLVMAGFFSAKAKWGGIDCWNPKELDSFKDYIHQWCWISNMYRVPFSEELPLEVDERMHIHRSIDFFRWVFLMFIVQAMMFKAPNALWRAFNTFSGINIKKVVTQALETQFDSEKNRDNNMANLSLIVDRWLDKNRELKFNRLTRIRDRLTKFFFCFATKRSGCFLTRLYLFIKVLYLVNLLAQFQILSVFLHFNYWDYGHMVVNMIGSGETWRDLLHFPRIGMCDMEIRQLQNIQRHTVQCALPINMYLEKAYAALWFYMIILSIFTALSIVKNTVEILSSSRRQEFLHKYFKWIGQNPNGAEPRRFVQSYLRDDGIFLIRLLALNVGELVTFDLVKQLWGKYTGSEVKENFDIGEDENSPLKINSTKPFRRSKGGKKPSEDNNIPGVDGVSV